MPLARFAGYALWVAPAVLLSVVALIMVRRRLHRELPAFFAYSVISVVRIVVMFVLYHRNFDIYAHYYWVSQALSATLGLAVIYEVFVQVFRGYGATRPLGSLLFRWAGTVLLLAAVGFAVITPVSDETLLMGGILVLERSVRLMQCGLLFFLFTFASYLRLPWRNNLFGIGLGFGLFAAVQLAAVAMRTQVGLISQETWVFVKMASYDCGVLVWVAYLLSPQPVEDVALSPAGTEVNRWNQALLQILQR